MSGRRVVTGLILLFMGISPVLRAGVATVEESLPWPEPDAQEVAHFSAELRKGLPKSDFRYSRVGPWIVASDLEASELEHYMKSTISRFGAAIQRQLFTKKVRTKPVKVYLFKDYKGYLYYNLKIFEEPASSPYGFFIRSKNAIVMNIGTGGGTLLHEMVHAMVEADFPGISAWLNEGIGSLFEQSNMTSAGKVIGISNWRLKGLQKLLARDAGISFSTLFKLNDQAYYKDEMSGAYYATSRYLMQWLQDHGLLETFYTRIRDQKDAKPEAVLRGLFDNKFSLEQIQASWEKWAKELKAP